MRFFYDTEFIEDGRTIELVSIGIVSEDGREYYAVNRNVSWERLAHPKFSWLRENVWSHLPTTGRGQLALEQTHPDVIGKDRIAEEVKVFLLGTEEEQATDGTPEIELWADYCAYDHVALCQLWGRMIDKPEGIPYQTNDIIQLAKSVGVNPKDFPKQDPATLHHALHDAKHTAHLFSAMPMLAARGGQAMILGADELKRPIHSDAGMGMQGRASA